MRHRGCPELEFWVQLGSVSSVRLERLASVEQMVDGPVGHYAAADHFLLWCTRPELCGIVLWGRLTIEDLERLTYVYDRGEGTGIAKPCDFVFDARRLEGVEPDVYETLASRTSERIHNIAGRLRRQAFVRSAGLLGAAVTGFYQVLEVQFESRVFPELGPALEWLGETGHQLADRLEHLIAETLSGSLVVDSLRAWLASQIPQRALIGDAARALGISSRSLQRQLADVGTSFRAELDRARLELAQKLLLETELKLAAIADRVGLSTEANLISFFRRLTGESPAEWRQTRR